MAKATKPKTKGKYDITIKTNLTADQLLSGMLSEPKKKLTPKKK